MQVALDGAAGQAKLKPENLVPVKLPAQATSRRRAPSSGTSAGTTDGPVLDPMAMLQQERAARRRKRAQGSGRPDHHALQVAGLQLASEDMPSLLLSAAADAEGVEAIDPALLMQQMREQMRNGRKC